MTDHWFWRWVDSSAGPDECWSWMRSYFHDGYGQVKVVVNGKRTGRRSNRIALELSLGRPLGDGLVARHTCHNTRCCNPAHLLEGTVRENIEDERIRGTMPVKVRDEDVPVIRGLVASGSTQADIARQYAVDPSLISRIVSGQRWGHVR